MDEVIRISADIDSIVDKDMVSIAKEGAI
jgi:hypothetical protein